MATPPNSTHHVAAENPSASALSSRPLPRWTRFLSVSAKINYGYALALSIAVIGNESVVHLFKAVPPLLTAEGSLIVQTIYPVLGCREHPYQDGWRAGSWTGFSSDFVDPAPWYFRTIESWVRLFGDNGLRLVELREPLHPETGKPASIILAGVRSLL